VSFQVGRVRARSFVSPLSLSSSSLRLAPNPAYLLTPSLLYLHPGPSRQSRPSQRRRGHRHSDSTQSRSNDDYRFVSSFTLLRVPCVWLTSINLDFAFPSSLTFPRLLPPRSTSKIPRPSLSGRRLQRSSKSVRSRRKLPARYRTYSSSLSGEFLSLSLSLSFLSSPFNPLSNASSTLLSSSLLLPFPQSTSTSSTTFLQFTVSHLL